jgi:hypothetical protein
MPEPERRSTGLGIWILVGLLLLIGIGAMVYFAPIAKCPICERRADIAVFLGRFDPEDCAFCKGKMKMSYWERWKAERFIKQASYLPQR